MALTSSGQITGTSYASGGEGEISHAFLYSQGKMTDLGTLPGYQNSGGNAINALGQVAGITWESTPDDEGIPQAFLWRDGVMQVLGTLPGYTSSQATALNSHGQVVGFADLPAPPSPLQSFLRDHLPFGPPSNASSDPSAPTRAFLYQNGRMTDLNALLPAHSGWVLESANGINDRGQIVGTGLHGGLRRAFVLTPVGTR